MTMMTTATQQSISSKQCNRLEVDYLALGWFFVSFCSFVSMMPHSLHLHGNAMS